MKSCCEHSTKRKITSPYDLDEYFASGYDETENPFIVAASRSWGKYVPLTGAISAAILLLLAYIASFFNETLGHFFIVFVFFLAGTPALIVSLRNLLSLNINIQVLMTTAALLSVLIGKEMEGGLLLVLFSLSEALEETVTKKTRGALHALHKLAPTMADVVGEDGVVYQKSVKEIELKTKIIVKAGEVVPLDGIVVHGTSFVNLSHLTGESVPISKKIGDEVQAGSLNTDGALTLQVSKTSAESTLAKIIRLVTEAGEAKPKLQRFLDRFSTTYATSVILLSFFFGIFLPVFMHQMPYLGTEGSIYRALAFLIAASPCALIIATPTAYLSSISSCARRGILLKGGIVLDALARCKRLAFDKTGTLTTGRLSCKKIDLSGNCYSVDEGLSIAYGLERAVVHPIAKAIISYAEDKKIPSATIEELKVIPGQGVQGKVMHEGELKPCLIGSSDYILSQIKDEERASSMREAIDSVGHVVTLLLVDKTILTFHFVDEIRNDLKSIVKTLRKGLKLTMLTGDNRENAEFVATEVGIDEIHAGLKPEDKMHIVGKLADEDPLIMVGDGLNDAPALTRAMVGIAMGKVGSATAIEAADIVLLRDDLSLIGWLYKKSRMTTRVVKQNLTLALLVITCASILSIAGIVPLWLAVILHEGSTVTVGLNSLRLLR